MKATDTKTTTQLHTQTEAEQQPFFQKEGADRTSAVSGQPFFQPKLKVGRPGDKYEREADATADRVVNQLPAPAVQAKCAACEAEEEEIQRKPIFESAEEQVQQKAIAPSLQLQEAEAAPDEEMKEVPEEEEMVQAKCATCAEEEENAVQPKSEAPPEPVGSDLESRLNSTKGKGSPLPEETRSSMGSALGADFGGVRVHTGSSAVQMSQELGAHAFTHGSDIYFNAGKYDTGSKDGQRLLAHELVHTVQQGGVKRNINKKDISNTNETTIQRGIFGSIWGGIKSAGSWVGSQVASGARAAWGGIRSVGGKIWSGIKTVGGWIAEGARWIFERIKGLVTSGIEWITNKFSDIKDFAISAFDQVKSGLNGLMGFILSPIDLIKSAFSNLDADLLTSGWNAIRKGVITVWNGIKSVINGVFSIADGLWNTVSSFASNLISTVGGLIDSRLFGLLPGFLKDQARSLFNSVKALWDRVRNFFTDLLVRLRAFTNRILGSIENFANRVINFGINTIISTVRKIKSAWDIVSEIAADPEGAIRPIVEGIASKIIGEAPAKAQEEGQKKMREHYPGNQSSISESGVIQRSPDNNREERSTTSFYEVGDGIYNALSEAWGQLDIREMLWDTLKKMFWPPETIKAIGQEFSELWSTDWANAVDSFFMPRNILEDPLGFFHDLWSNMLILLDFPLALWRRLNNILMLLLGYIAIILIVGGAILGGAVGGVLSGGPGILPGAWIGIVAGAEAAGAVGIFLLKSFLLAEGLSIAKALLDLFTARQTHEEKDRDYVQIAGSLIGIGIALVIVVIFWLLAELISAVVRIIKSRGAGRSAEGGRTTEAESGRTTEAESGRMTEAESGRTTEAESGRTTEAESGRTTEAESGRTTEAESGRTTEAESGRTTEAESGRTTEAESGRTSESELSGRRPSVPERPVLDTNGNLTEYGKWYYERPSGFRNGIRERVWRNAEAESIDGIVRDPLTGQELSPTDPWQMGHRYGYEFRKHQLSASRRGISRREFLNEHNNPNHYQPELPESNWSHQGEAPDNVYYGD
ncbi:MAG: DUF4157 domain-containing protein [Saprospiraceae bacterium]